MTNLAQTGLGRWAEDKLVQRVGAGQWVGIMIQADEKVIHIQKPEGRSKENRDRTHISLVTPPRDERVVSGAPLIRDVGLHLVVLHRQTLWRPEWWLGDREGGLEFGLKSDVIIGKFAHLALVDPDDLRIF